MLRTKLEATREKLLMVKEHLEFLRLEVVLREPLEEEVQERRDWLDSALRSTTPVLRVAGLTRHSEWLSAKTGTQLEAIACLLWQVFNAIHAQVTSIGTAPESAGGSAMVVFLLTDGRTSMFEKGVEVIHRPHSVECLDGWGNLMVSLSYDDVAGYTFDRKYLSSLRRITSNQPLVVH